MIAGGPASQHFADIQLGTICQLATLRRRTWDKKMPASVQGSCLNVELTSPVRVGAEPHPWRLFAAGVPLIADRAELVLLVASHPFHAQGPLRHKKREDKPKRKGMWHASYQTWNDDFAVNALGQSCSAVVHASVKRCVLGCSWHVCPNRSIHNKLDLRTHQRI